MFNDLTELVRQTQRRLRQTSGVGAQLYAEDIIVQYLRETYEMVRMVRWWDHLMQLRTGITLDGSTGRITSAYLFEPKVVREGFKDLHSVLYGGSNTPLPVAGQDQNPTRMRGDAPRVIQPMNYTEDPLNRYLFRVWPLTARADEPNTLTIRARVDPVGIFTNPAVVIPFDTTVLVNGAAEKYMADDASNPAALAVLGRTFNARLQQLQTAHDAMPIAVNGAANQFGPVGWYEHGP